MKVPQDVFNALVEAGADVVIQEPGFTCLNVDHDEPEIRLHLKTMVDSFLSSIACAPNEGQDPLVTPGFGWPAFVRLEVGNEVHSILHTYSTLTAAALIGLNPQPPLVANAAIPMAGAHAFHHAQRSLLCVRARISNPGDMAPNIAALPSGNVICELTITFPNGAIMERIRRN